MRKITRLLAGFAILLGAVTTANAQQKATATQLKVQIVFSEYDDGKKVSSLPYTFMAVGELERNMWGATVRLGVSVPVVVQEKENINPTTQYQDIGTNIDFSAKRYEDGQYKLSFSVERSSVYVPDSSGKDPIRAAGQGSFYTPLLRRYRGSFDVLLHDGETVQGPVSTDPQTGLVLKSEITLNVLR